MASLIFTPRTQSDATFFNEVISQSNYHAEWNTRENYFTFEEKKKDLDALEFELTALIAENGINGHFEAE